MFNTKSLLFFATGELLGLILYLLIGSTVRAIQPIWWGGEALLIPLVFGVGFIIVGALPLHALAETWLSRLARISSVRSLCLIGALVGASFLQLNDVLAMLLRPIPLWQSLHPLVAVLVALSISGVVSALLATTLVAVFLKRQVSQA
jgi:hypothetical protein